YRLRSSHEARQNRMVNASGPLAPRGLKKFK
ncbi:MAG: histidine utilization repressor, partial [Stutzerimonas stutzeri]